MNVPKKLPRVLLNPEKTVFTDKKGTREQKLLSKHKEESLEEPPPVLLVVSLRKVWPRGKEYFPKEEDGGGPLERAATETPPHRGQAYSHKRSPENIFQ